MPSDAPKPAWLRYSCPTCGRPRGFKCRVLRYYDRVPYWAFVDRPHAARRKKVKNAK